MHWSLKEKENLRVKREIIINSNTTNKLESNLERFYKETLLELGNSRPRKIKLI